MNTADVQSSATVRQRKWALSGKDLINIGVFSALYIVIFFGLGMLGLLGPGVMLVAHGLSVLANGVVAALLLARVPRLGALTSLMTLAALLMTATGHPWYGLLILPLLGLLGDVVAATGRHCDRWRNALAYAVVSLWYITPMLPIFWDSVGYKQYIASSMGQEYADMFMALFSPTTLIIMEIAYFGLGLLGGWFGQRLISKHFRRAGVA